MEFGPVLSEDEALIKKAVRPEEYDKIKLISGRRRFRGETIQQAKVLEEFKNTGIHAWGDYYAK
jgi:DNA polymerase-3 subunit alpha